MLQACCLRVCLGLPRSTPHLALQIESGIQPPAIRHRELSARFVSRIIAISPDSPIATIFASYLRHADAIWHRTPPCTYTLTRLLDLSLAPASDPDLHADRYIPTWMFSSPEIIVPAFPTSSLTSPAVMHTLFNESISAYRPHFAFVFTDGSFTPSTGRTTCSFYIPSLHTSTVYRLPDNTGIYSAELSAIHLAIKHLINTSLSPAIVISDSKSALASLAPASTNRSSVHWRLIHRIRQDLHIAHMTGLQIVLHWVPSHVGVEGNEEADRLARFADAPLTVLLPYTANSQLHDFSLALRLEWQDCWNNSTKCRCLFRIKPQVEIWPHLSFGRRCLTSTLARLRTGHSFLHHSAHRHGLHPSPACRFCGEPETEEHFIAHCPSLVGPRDAFLQTTLDSIPGSELTAEYLLRGGNPPFNHHKQIFNALWNFIQATGVKP